MDLPANYLSRSGFTETISFAFLFCINISFEWTNLLRVVTKDPLSRVFVVTKCCEGQKIRVILSSSFYNGLNEKIVFEAEIIREYICLKIVLHNYISYKADLTYIGSFPMYLRIDLIFTDFPTGSGSRA